jgi:hypothetical protein
VAKEMGVGTMMQDLGKGEEEAAEYAEVHPLPKPGEVGRGRKRASDRSPKAQHGETADYLARRLARDRPDTPSNRLVVPRSRGGPDPGSGDRR